MNTRTDRIVQAIAAIFLTVVATAAVVSLAAPAPWSPMGQSSQVSQEQEPPTFDIPPGYEAAVPTQAPSTEV